MRNKTSGWLIIAMISSLVMTYYIFGQVFLHPAGSLHELSGDAIKNYYSFLQHAMHGNGWWYTGSNYPYGEHILYTDGQPALSLLLTQLRKIVQLTPASVTLILNLTLMLAFWLAIIFTYKILVRYKVADLWAVLFACIIISFSTQNTRLFGLYGQSYAVFMPMLLYWSSSYYDTSRTKYMLYVLVMTLIAMFLHPYQMALVLIWCALYIIGYLLLKKSNAKEKLLHIIPVFITLLIPLIIFKTTLALTDPVTDRTTYPHGLLEYRIIPTDIILSARSNISIWFREHRMIGTAILHEGFAYIGFAPFCALMMYLTVLLFFKIRKKSMPIGQWESYPVLFLFIAVCTLIYAMGIPFIWHLEWLYDHVGAFRQFRALEWFGLIFYYVFATTAAMALYHASRKLRMSGYRIIGILILIIPTIVWAYESFGFASNIRSKTKEFPYYYQLFHNTERTNWSTYLQNNGYKGTDFQATLYIPYYHIGSEKLWLTAHDFGHSLTTSPAFELELPMANAQISRASWSRTFKQVKINSGPFVYKPLLYEIKDERPYLLMRLKDVALGTDEQYLFDNADSIGYLNSLYLYALHPAKLRKADSLSAAHARNIASEMSANDTSLLDAPFFSNHFDSENSSNILFGEGAAPAIADSEQQVALINISSWPKDRPYELSAWLLVNDKDYRMPYGEIILMDSTGSHLSSLLFETKTSTDNNNMWFRTHKYINIPQECTAVSLKLYKQKKGVYIALDELLLRQAADTIISKDASGRVMANNHLLQ